MDVEQTDNSLTVSLMEHTQPQVFHVVLISHYNLENVSEDIIMLGNL